MTLDHDVVQQWLLRRRDGVLSPDHEQALDLHLADCDRCRAAADEIGMWQTTLDMGLRARYSGAVSAETRQNQRLLKQRLATTARQPISQWPAFAVGLTAMFILVSLLTQLPLGSEVIATTTSSASRVINEATAASRVINEATATPRATNVPTTAATLAAPPTPTSIPTNSREGQAAVDAVATDPPPTARATPVASAIAEEPTQAVDEPTAEVAVGEPPQLMLDLLYFLHYRSDWQADERAALFSDQVIYSDRSLGERTLTRQEMVTELGHLHYYVSWFRVDGCVEHQVQAGEGRIRCQLSMENNWRAAFRFDVYQGTLTVHYDANTQRITRVADLQRAEDAEKEREIVARFVVWHNETYDGEPLVLDVNASPRLSTQHIPINDVLAWVRAGSP